MSFKFFSFQSLKFAFIRVISGNTEHSTLNLELQRASQGQMSSARKRSL